MNEHQVLALHDPSNFHYLASTLTPIFNIFLQHLKCRVKIIDSDEQKVVNSHDTEEARLHSLLQVLINKDGGWQALIVFLKTRHYGSVAVRLEMSATRIDTPSIPCYQNEEQNEDKLTDGNVSTLERYPSPEGHLVPVSLDEFTLELAYFYLSNYSQMRTLREFSKDIKAWVLLPVEEKTQSSRQNNRFYPNELLHRLASDMSASVALIKAGPGMGKTTLIKKLAYEWAMERLAIEKRKSEELGKKTKKPKRPQSSPNLHSDKPANSFRLILALPLRAVGGSKTFHELALEYFVNRLGDKRFKSASLMNEIIQLQSELLLCFDGLDEYENYEESPFQSLIEGPRHHQSSAPSLSSSIQFIKYKIMITSRPYAFEHLNRDFYPLQFEICRLDESHLVDFVEAYCKQKSGQQRALNFLRSHNFAIKVPLIHTFVCYLADEKEEIPAKITLLYDSFLREMWLREKKEKRLDENDVDVDQWKRSNVVQSTAALAYWGCKNRKSEFNPKEQKKFQLSMDSFKCGFLIHKFDFIQGIQMAEFLHLSIQEFFAALHCYNRLLSVPDSEEIKWIIKKICNGDSQLGLFLFGIASQNQNLSKLLHSFFPHRNQFSLLDAVEYSLDFWTIVSRFSDCLGDCCDTDVRECGQWLANLIGLCEIDISDSRRVKVLSLKAQGPTDVNFNPIFGGGLQLCNHQKSPFEYDCYICGDAETAKVAWITGKLTALMSERFKKFDLVLWLWKKEEVPEELHHFPPVRTMIVRTKEVCTREVNIYLNYQSGTPVELQFFSFGCENVDRLEQIAKSSCSFLTVVSQSQPGEIIWLNVAVTGPTDRVKLIKGLIKLAALWLYSGAESTNGGHVVTSTNDFKCNSGIMYSSNVEDSLRKDNNYEVPFDAGLFISHYPGMNVLSDVHNAQNTEQPSYAEIAENGPSVPATNAASVNDSDYIYDLSVRQRQPYGPLPQLPVPKPPREKKCDIM